MSVTSTHSSLAPGIAEIPRALNTSHLITAEQLKDISEHPSLTHVDNFAKFNTTQLTVLDYTAITSNTTLDHGTKGKLMAHLTVEALINMSPTALQMVLTNFSLDNFQQQEQQEFTASQLAYTNAEILSAKTLIKPDPDTHDKAVFNKKYECDKNLKNNHFYQFNKKNLEAAEQKYQQDLAQHQALEAAAQAQKVAFTTPAPQFIKPQDRTVEEFMRSPEYDTCLVHIEEAKQAIEYKENDSFLSLLQDYKRAVEDQASAKSNLAQLKKKLDHNEITLTYAQSHRGLLHQLLNKLKAALRGDDQLFNKCRNKIQVPLTQEILVNPIEMHTGITSLCGIFLILYSEFMKPRMSVFTKSVLDLNKVQFDAARCKNDLPGIVRDYCTIINHWKNSDLFPYMTMDNYFTLQFLLSLDPTSKLREEVLKQITNFFRTRENSALSLEAPEYAKGDLIFDDMPLFSIIVAHIQEVMMHKDELTAEINSGTHAKSATQTIARSGFNKSSFMKRTPQISYQLPVDRSVEAAMTAVAPITHAPGKLPAMKVPTGYTALPHNCKFDRVVVPAEKYVYPVAMNKWGTYTATLQKCVQCSVEDRKQHHEIRCFLKLCHECGHYGHTNHVCRQTNSVVANLAEKNSAPFSTEG